MTEFEQLLDSQQFAIDTLVEMTMASHDPNRQQKLRLHRARLIGIKNFLELYNLKLEKNS